MLCILLQKTFQRTIGVNKNTELTFFKLPIGRTLKFHDICGLIKNIRYLSNHMSNSNCFRTINIYNQATVRAHLAFLIRFKYKVIPIYLEFMQDLRSGPLAGHSSGLTHRPSAALTYPLSQWQPMSHLRTQNLGGFLQFSQVSGHAVPHVSKCSFSPQSNGNYITYL